jgi:hypothetical protein
MIEAKNNPKKPNDPKIHKPEQKQDQISPCSNNLTQKA